MLNQIIYTIQCEGPNIGRPCVLIRTQGCNLKCPWCDTKQSWNENEGFHEKIADKRISTIFENHTNVRNIMLTGGEPLYNHFENVMTYINSHPLLKSRNIEIETNGTLISQNKEILNQNKNKITLNISPKLESWCHSECQDEQKIDELYSMNIQTVKELQLNYHIKFVYNSGDCYCEDKIDGFIQRNDIDLNDVSIMTLTKNGKDIDLNQCKKTIEFCKRKGLRYTPRLHLMIYKDDINENSV